MTILQLVFCNPRLLCCGVNGFVSEFGRIFFCVEMIYDIMGVIEKLRTTRRRTWYSDLLVSGYLNSYSVISVHVTVTEIFVKSTLYIVFENP